MCDLLQSDSLLYAWGQSSLGEFIAAKSDQGLVAFEFAGPGGNAVKDLQERFPSVEITEHPAAMAEMIAALAHLVGHPDEDPRIPLDMRGTDYERKVWSLLREIPAGSSTTYGTIAARMGTPSSARAVAKAIAANRLAIVVPCHRVVEKNGSLAGYRWGLERKRDLLFRERHAIASRHMA